MPNEYLVECHDYISQELTQLQFERENAIVQGHAGKIHEIEGQRDALTGIREYLEQNINLETQSYGS